MNSIINGWNSTKQAEGLIFIVLPQVRTNIREKGKREKNMKMGKSKENTLIFIVMYMHLHQWTHKHIYIQIHRCTYTYLLSKSDGAFWYYV